jgi:hypothetical protein
MTLAKLDDFRQSLTATEPPAGLTLAMAGLWWDAKGDWKRAHETAEREGSSVTCALRKVARVLPLNHV